MILPSLCFWLIFSRFVSIFDFSVAKIHAVVFERLACVIQRLKSSKIPIFRHTNPVFYASIPPSFVEIMFIISILHKPLESSRTMDNDDRISRLSYWHVGWICTQYRSNPVKPTANAAAILQLWPVNDLRNSMPPDQCAASSYRPMPPNLRSGRL